MVGPNPGDIVILLGNIMSIYKNKEFIVTFKHPYGFLFKDDEGNVILHENNYIIVSNTKRLLEDLISEDLE